MGIDCAYSDCYLHARYYYSGVFYLLFFLNICEIIKQKISDLIEYRSCTIPDDDYGMKLDEEDNYAEDVDPFVYINNFIQ